jgi:UDP-N-acetylmuramate--alanine ligase
VVALDGPETLAAVVKPLVSSGDMVVCLGAGNITAWAEKLPRELAAAEGEAGA